MDSVAHIATMAYNVFLHSSSGETSFFLMFGWDTYMPILFKLLLPKIRFKGEKSVGSIWMP